MPPSGLDRVCADSRHLCCCAAGDRVGIQPPEVAHGHRVAVVFEQILQAGGQHAGRARRRADTPEFEYDMDGILVMEATAKTFRYLDAAEVSAQTKASGVKK